LSEKRRLPTPHAGVDVTDAVCPMTFVKAKVALDVLEPGQILSIRLSDGEPIRNVPRSLKDDGHRVLGLTDNGDGTYDLLVEKGQD
jgi:TusA-related sulfurtransferase